MNILLYIMLRGEGSTHQEGRARLHGRQAEDPSRATHIYKDTHRGNKGAENQRKGRVDIGILEIIP
jgi:hypothetical protein